MKKILLLLIILIGIISLFGCGAKENPKVQVEAVTEKEKILVKMLDAPFNIQTLQGSTTETSTLGNVSETTDFKIDFGKSQSEERSVDLQKGKDIEIFTDKESKIKLDYQSNEYMENPYVAETEMSDIPGNENRVFAFYEVGNRDTNRYMYTSNPLIASISGIVSNQLENTELWEFGEDVVFLERECYSINLKKETTAQGVLMSDHQLFLIDKETCLLLKWQNSLLGEETGLIEYTSIAFNQPCDFQDMHLAKEGYEKVEVLSYYKNTEKKK